MAFPTELSNVQDDVTDVVAAHINNLEAKVGADGSAVTTSHDYKIAQLETNNTGTNTGDETTTTLGSKINGATEKTTPVDADMVGLMDSAATNILKKLSWADIKATLKTYFDTLYQAAGSYLTASSTNTLTNKTIDANGTGNSISNIEVADLATGVLDTDLTSVSASDDTIPSAKAVKTYVDANAGGGGAWELIASINNISTPSASKSFSSISTDYKYLKVIFTAYRHASTTGSFVLTINSTGGTSYSQVRKIASSSSTSTSTTTSAAYWTLFDFLYASPEVCTGELVIYNMPSMRRTMQFRGNDADLKDITIGGEFNDTAQATTITFAMSGGDGNVYGDFQLYGMK